MTQAIDPIKLKAAAEHLEWVLKQYPDNDDVQGLHHALLRLIEDAKAEKVSEVMERIPCEYNFADGIYRSYKDPNVEDAYVAFAREMRGGLTEKERQLLSRMEDMRKAAMERGIKP